MTFWSLVKLFQLMVLAENAKGLDCLTDKLREVGDHIRDNFSFIQKPVNFYYLKYNF